MSTNNAATKVYSGEWGAFSTSVVTNGIILVAILLGFFILRAMRKNDYLYQPQYYDRYASPHFIAILFARKNKASVMLFFFFLKQF
jgi:hypothetical protein